MARRKDNPLLQAAKGFPGRRRKAVEKEIDELAEKAAEQSIPEAGPIPVPEEFAKAPAYWSVASRIWGEKSSSLRTLGRNRPVYASALVRYCIWSQLYISAANQMRRDLPKGGVSIKVVKGDGETVIRAHPSVEFMSRAESALRLLDQEFGFTPSSDQTIMRNETFNAAQGKLPFGGGAAPGQGRKGNELPPDPMDLMTESDSEPPAYGPN